MQRKMQRLAVNFIVQNHRHRVWKKIVSVLACIVVFCTTYALILPAITLENPTRYCGLSEHRHDESCYEKRTICGAEAGEANAEHIHTEECYQMVLTCAKQEHVHALNCYSNPAADIESPEEWQNSVSSVTLTGNWHTDLISVAESQLGYAESDKNFMVAEDGETKKGYTRYGAWCGDPYGDWSTMFVSFCLSYAGIPAEAFTGDKTCSGWVAALQSEENGFYLEREKYVPKAGDLVFFDTDGDRTADNVGLVAELVEAAGREPTILRTIEGDSENCVRYVNYSIEDVGILGYGKLPNEPRVEYKWSWDGIEVVAAVRESADLPENAVLVVKPLLPEDLGDAYGNKYAASQAKIAEKNLAEITRFDLFKIYLEADGSEVLSGEDATVEIRFPKGENKESTFTELYHYSPDGTVTHDPNFHEEAGNLIGSFDTTLSGEYAIVLADGIRVLAGETSSETSSEKVSESETGITAHKYIDAFRDGEDNPDTQLDNNQLLDKTDLYRIYLDAQMNMANKPIDLLIVVDQSGSMHMDYNGYWDDMTKENGAQAYRDEALRMVLNGTSKTDIASYQENKEKGLIYQFLQSNPDNKVCVVGFQGHDGYGNRFKETADGELDDVTSGKIRVNSNIRNDYTTLNVSSGIADIDGYLEAETLLDWTSDPTFVDIRGIYFNATNYTAGFIQAQRELDDTQIKDNGHQKVILFLSDGIPTCYVEKKRVNVGGIFRPQYESHYVRGGDGQGSNNGQKEKADVTAATNTAFTNFITANPEAILHTVSIKGGEAVDRLENMATAGKGKCFSVSTTDDLEANLRQLMFDTSYTHLIIKDELSEYVDIIADQPDYKVTMTDTEGNVKTLWTDGAATTDGANIVDTVIYDSIHKTVTCQFVENYEAKPGTTFTLSFNVQTNRTAYEYYMQHGGYPPGVTGDADTDYGGNTTSSGQGGFRSNASAFVTYTQDGASHTEYYPHPVVQAASCKAAVQKTDSSDSNITLPGAEFTLYREPFAGETGEPLEGLNGSYIKVAEKLATGADGVIVFDNLIPGDYCLVETKSPDGYRRLSAPVSFTLTRKADGTGQIVGSERTIIIDNETLPALQIANTAWGHELPQTGGIGSVPYITGVLVLMTAAAILLLHQMQKRRKEDMKCT